MSKKLTVKNIKFKGEKKERRIPNSDVDFLIDRFNKISETKEDSDNKKNLNNGGK